VPRRAINPRMKLPRSKGGVAPRVHAQMDRFIEGLLMGLGSTQAAVFAGVSSRSAARQGQKWKVDLYVRERFAKLREKLSHDEICSFAELALNVKSMAFDELAICTADRIRASKLMAQMLGHMAETKVSTTVNGGVLLLPVAESMEAWESQAIAAQAALQKEVEQDANR
jgi:hypothetical protein